MTTLEKEVVVISIKNGKKTILGHLIKKEMDTILDISMVGKENKASTTKKGQNSIVTNVGSSRIAYYKHI